MLREIRIQFSVQVIFFLNGGCVMKEQRSEEHTSELQSHRDLHSFPTRRSSDLNNFWSFFNGYTMTLFTPFAKRISKKGYSRIDDRVISGTTRKLLCCEK